MSDQLEPAPTQTAEPMRTAQGDASDRLIEFAEHILGVPLDPWQKRLCRRVFGGNVGRSTGRPDATPLSTADMVHGKPIAICTCGHAVGEHWGPALACTMVECGCTHPVHKEFFDPSTTRALTPSRAD